MRQKNGSIIWISCNATVQNDQDKNLTWIDGVTEDITQRKRIEEEKEKLLKELTFHNALIETTSDIVVLVDMENNLLYVNPAGMMIASRPTDDYRSLTIEELYSKQVSQFLEKQIIPFVNQTGIWTGEQIIRYSEGYEIPVSMVVVLIRNREKEPIAYGITMRDMTENKLLEQQQQLLNAAYERFVPREFLSFLNKKSIIDVKLGDQVEKEMTILFCDIRDFTTLSETMTPQENFNFLNSYLGHVEPLIGKYHGFIDKFIGDAILALFPSSPDEALQAAIAILKQIVIYNEHRFNQGYEEIRIGIGLNTGKLMLGTVGGEDRMDGTVISDSVNLASRLEGMTKLYNSSLLISQSTFMALKEPNQYLIRVLDEVRVKGKEKPVSVFEVLDGEPEEIRKLKLATLRFFDEGIVAYRSKALDKAIAMFQKCIAINPHDQAARYYLQLCRSSL